MPSLLKPAPARLLALLSLLEDNAAAPCVMKKPRPLGATLAQLPAAGLTSCAPEKLPGWVYRAAGFYTCRARVIRFDMLERLADIIRPLLAENRQGFEANEAMMSIMGCGADELAEILTALGYRAQQLAAANRIMPRRHESTAQETKTAEAEAGAETLEAQAIDAQAGDAQTRSRYDKSRDRRNTLVKTLWRPAPRGHNKQKKTNGQKIIQRHVGQEKCAPCPPQSAAR